MNDYLELYRKFKDIKDIEDYIDEVEKLRFYFQTQQIQMMLEHIRQLTEKYKLETLTWNFVNQYRPIDYTEAYINAERFMQFHGAKLVAEKVLDFKKQLSQDEIAFIESMIKPME